MERINTDVLDMDIKQEQVPSTLIHINKKEKRIYNFFKRCVDIIGSLIGLILLIPITLFVYLLRIIKHENEGPMFYEQLRIGKYGNEFRIYKFRTMVMHADERLFKYLDENEEASREYKKYKKIKNDPRVTRGRTIFKKD